MNSARAWLNRARGLTQVRTPLKKMRDTLHAGLRLGTTLPEVEQLRIDIRRREWEESAKRVLSYYSSQNNSHSHNVLFLGAQSCSLFCNRKGIS